MQLTIESFVEASLVLLIFMLDFRVSNFFSIKYPQDEPLSPNDDVERQLRSKKQQSTDDDSAEIEAASFKKFPVEVNSLARVS